MLSWRESKAGKYRPGSCEMAHMGHGSVSNRTPSQLLRFPLGFSAFNCMVIPVDQFQVRIPAYPERKRRAACYVGPPAQLRGNHSNHAQDAGGAGGLNARIGVSGRGGHWHWFVHSLSHQTGSPKLMRFLFCSVQSSRNILKSKDAFNDMPHPTWIVSTTQRHVFFEMLDPACLKHPVTWLWLVLSFSKRPRESTSKRQSSHRDGPAPASQNRLSFAQPFARLIGIDRCAPIPRPVSGLLFAGAVPLSVAVRLMLALH